MPNGTDSSEKRKLTADYISEIAEEQIPKQMANMVIDDVFILYAGFCGDVERTAHAADITPSQVIELAAQHGWNERLKSIFEMKKSGRSGDVERAVNRALNFIQAHRFRKFLEKVFNHIAMMPMEELDQLLITESPIKGGGTIRHFTTRPLADLAAALEKCHALTYLALNDSTTERRGRDETPDADVSSGQLHAKIAAAMSRPEGQALVPRQ